MLIHIAWQSRRTVTDTHPSLQSTDGRSVEYISDHTVGLDLVESTSGTAGNDTSCILSSARQSWSLSPCSLTDRCCNRDRPSTLRSSAHILFTSLSHEPPTSPDRHETSGSSGDHGAKDLVHHTLYIRHFSTAHNSSESHSLTAEYSRLPWIGIDYMYRQSNIC